MKWKITSTDAPVVRAKYAIPLAWVLASLMLLMSLAHLVRIDKLIPVIAQTVSDITALYFVVLIVTFEVFALPFLLRLRMSVLARFLSGLLVVTVPLVWTCFSIWAIGNGHSTGQFSSYVNAPSSWLLILLNLAWLVASYVSLWFLGFDKTFAALSKKQ